MYIKLGLCIWMYHILLCIIVSCFKLLQPATPMLKLQLRYCKVTTETGNLK